MSYHCDGNALCTCPQNLCTIFTLLDDGNGFELKAALSSRFDLSIVLRAANGEGGMPGVSCDLLL